MKQNYCAYIAALSSTTIIAFSYLFSKIMLSYSDPLMNLAHRYLVSAIVLLCLQCTNCIHISLNKKDILAILPLSLFYPLLFFTFQTIALKFITSSEAGIVQAMSPIFTFILAGLFLKEKTNLIQKFSLGLSVFGVVYISIAKGVTFESDSSFGFFIILLSVLFNSCYNVLSKRKVKFYTSLELAYVLLLTACIVFNVLALVRQYNLGDMLAYLSPFQHIDYIFAVLYLAIPSSIITMLLSIYAIQKIGASQMRVFSNFGTVLTVMAGVIILSEPLYTYHIIGISLIIIGVLGVNLKLENKNIGIK